MTKHRAEPGGLPLPSSLSWRAVVLGTLLIPLNCLFILKTEVVWASMQATPLSLFFNVICTLFVLLALNGLVRRLWLAWALRPGEVLTVYVMVSAATALFGVDMLQIFLGLIPHPYHFADDSNRWQALFFRELPPWLVVTDREALKRLYEGHSTLFRGDHLAAWGRPVLAWSPVLGALVLSYLCLAALVRRPWMDQERLTFPVIQLPLAMATLPGFWRSGWLWAGFGLAGSLNVLRGLNQLWPAVPTVPRTIDLGLAVVAPPWNAIGWTPLGVYPFALGLGYLMPLDLTFSCWVFYLFWKAQVILRAALGWDPLVGAYLGRQSSGAWIGIGLAALWGTRRHLRAALQSAMGRGPDVEQEPLSPRLAFLGLLLAAGVLVAFCRTAGMDYGVIFLFFSLYALVVVCVARMRAELGPPTHDLARGGPDHLLPMFLGTSALGPRHLTMLTLFDWFNYSYRQHPIAHHLEGFKVAQQVQWPMRRLTGVILWASLVAWVAWLTLALNVVYHEGLAAKILSYLDEAAQQAWDNLAAWITTPTDPDGAGIRQFAFGLFLTLGLMALRKGWLFFPLHPVGYAVCGCWTMSWMWFSMALAWFIKLLVIRYGGLRLYRRGLPFFFGLMLGDYVVGGGQCLIGAMLDYPVRGFFP